MMGYIQGQAPKTAGKWDIAAVPGGGGNWGGSFLAVPKQSKNQALAYELVKFLTSPASQALRLQADRATCRASPALYIDPAIANFKNPFFNNAPVGKIFTTSAKALKPQVTRAAPGRHPDRVDERDRAGRAEEAVARRSPGRSSSRTSQNVAT